MTERRVLDQAPVSARAATMLSLFGFVVMVAAIVYGFDRVSELRGQIAARGEDLAKLEAEISRLDAEIDFIRTGELSELASARAVAIPRPGLRDEEDRPLFNFMVWLKLPDSRKSGIREVRYSFGDESFLNKNKVSSEPSNGFAVGYLGWGAMRAVPITVVPVEGPEFTIDFPMFEQMEIVSR